MGSTVGHLASPQLLLLLLLYKMELFCDSRSRTRTRYTHTNTHAILLLLLLSRRVADLQERKKSLSGSSEEFSGRRNQKELLAAGTHTDARKTEPSFGLALAFEKLKNFCLRKENHDFCFSITPHIRSMLAALALLFQACGGARCL